MHDTGKKFLNLMFRPGETVCASIDIYGYHSIPLENAINGPVTLVPPTTEASWKNPLPEELTLIALNPIKGFRQDINCTAFRNFLVEMDYGDIPSQLAYIKRLGIPYSAAVFSGNKSIHFLISLDKDLPSEKVYRVFSEWILGVISLADPMTKNPSRSIRIPGAMRDGRMQELMEFNGPVKTEDLVNWLKKYPNEKPKEKEHIVRSENPDISKVKGWVCKKLVEGIVPPNRNRQWFSIGVEFYLAGYSEDDTIDILKSYFSSDRDFKQKEWETTIRSAFKWGSERKDV